MYKREKNPGVPKKKKNWEHERWGTPRDRCIMFDRYGENIKVLPEVIITVGKTKTKN